METFLHKMRTIFYNVELNKAKLEVYLYMHCSGPNAKHFFTK